MADKTFVRITNRNIYDRIEAAELKNDEAHINLSLHQKETNGKVKLNRWIATTALTVVLSISFYLIRLN